MRRGAPRIEAAGRLPIYAAGPDCYLRRLRWGLSDRAGKRSRPAGRLEAEVRELGPETMHDRLAAVDPVAAGRIAPRDAIRIVRALEVHELTGRPISQLQTEWVQPRARFPHRLIVLDMADALLRERLAARMRQMLEAGWIDETRALLARGLTPEAHCFKALGYREIAAYLRGKLTREETEQAILQRTWQFVRRQRTWLRREREATWIDAADGIRAGVATIEKLLEKDGTAFL